MLLKAERIITRDDMLIDRSNEEIVRLASGELSREIIKLMQEAKLLKLEMVQGQDNVNGPYVKVLMTVRAYHPDD